MARTVKTGPVFFILFSLPFAAVGVGVSAWLFSTVAGHWKMQRWQETPAKIVWAKLESHSDNDGTTYRATAEYAYQFGGRQYTGHQVSISGGSDNIGSYQQNVHRQLSGYRASGRSFRCYVNPERPAEAILFRDLRYEMVAFQALFATSFGAVGFGLLTFAVLNFFKARGNRALGRSTPTNRGCAKKNGPTARSARRPRPPRSCCSCAPSIGT